MAIEIHAWSKDPRPVDVDELAEQAARANGARLSVLRGFRSWGDFRIARRGRLRNSDLILGWVPEGPDDPDAAAIARDVQGRNGKGLARWHKKGLVAAATLFVGKAPDWEDGEREELLAAHGGKYVRYRDAARAHYVTHTSMSRGEGDLVLQQAVADWILQLRGGIFEDPQEGTFRLFPTRAKRARAR